MKIDFSSLAFGYKVLSRGSTPNWATALGQGREHKINNDPAIHELLKGMVYSSVQLSQIKTKVGRGGNFVVGDDLNSPIILGSVFPNVYINDIKIEDAKFILILTRDTSNSHFGRLRIKYGPSNTYIKDGTEYTNDDFFSKVKTQLSLENNACWFIYDISVINQDKLVLSTVVVDSTGTAEYVDNSSLHRAWEALIPNESNRIFEVSGGLDLKEYWMSLDNQEFIFSCLDFMKQYNLLNDTALGVLQNKELCAENFRHNSLNGILLEVDIHQGDNQRKDSTGNARYYTDTFDFENHQFYVSSEWRATREESRGPIIDWILNMVKGDKI